MTSDRIYIYSVRLYIYNKLQIPRGYITTTPIIEVSVNNLFYIFIFMVSE